MWVRLGALALLVLVVCTSVFFIVVSFDCNIVLDRSLTDCHGSHLNEVFAGRVVPTLQYMLHIACCCEFLWLARGMLCWPWTHIRRVYANAGLHMTEAVMWCCTAAAMAERAWAVGLEDAAYDVLAVAVVSVFLNSLCTSYAAHMNLASFTTLHDDYDDDEERNPFAYSANAERASVAEHGDAMLTLVRCLFVHNAALFLANTSYVVAMIMVSEDGGGHEHGALGRRVLVLLGLYVVWYRGSQSTFWFNKHNFPHANVMLPRYDGAAVRSPHSGLQRLHLST